MLKKEITYINFDDEEVTETFYFNLTNAEIIQMEVEFPGGLEGALNRIVEEQDNKKILDIIRFIIGKAYGQKSEDGKRFIKSQEATDAFFTSEPFSELIMEFFGDANKAADFFANLAPRRSSKLKIDEEYQNKTPEELRAAAMERMQGHLSKKD